MNALIWSGKRSFPSNGSALALRNAGRMMLLVLIVGAPVEAGASSLMTVDVKGGISNLVSFTAQIDEINPSPSTYYAGTLSASLNGGATFDAYCVDIYHTTYVGGGSSPQFLVNPLSIAQLDSQGPSSDPGGNGAGVGYLYDKFAPLVAEVSDPNQQKIDGAALQVAIWKVEYDKGGSLSTGHITLSDSSDPNSVQHELFVQATSYLSAYDGTQTGGAAWLQALDHPISSQGVALNQNLIGPGSLLPSQPLPVPAPEPSTVALAGVGILCLAACGYRARRAHTR